MSDSGSILRRGHRSHRPARALQRLARAGQTQTQAALGELVGASLRDRLLWLGWLAMPLVIPVALPGMGLVVGSLCLLVALGMCLDRSPPLPAWLARQRLSASLTSVLNRVLQRSMQLAGRFGRPRWLALSGRQARLFNGLCLSMAGLSMAAPVPLISFDNVLPALAIVFIAWGLRLRDGWMLLLGYVLSVLAVASVIGLWWWGSALAVDLGVWLSQTAAG